MLNILNTVYNRNYPDTGIAFCFHRQNELRLRMKMYLTDCLGLYTHEYLHKVALHTRLVEIAAFDDLLCGQRNSSFTQLQHYNL